MLRLAVYVVSCSVFYHSIVVVAVLFALVLFACFRGEEKPHTNTSLFAGGKFHCSLDPTPSGRCGRAVLPLF